MSNIQVVNSSVYSAHTEHKSVAALTVAAFMSLTMLVMMASAAMTLAMSMTSAAMAFAMLVVMMMTCRVGIILQISCEVGSCCFIGISGYTG